MKWLKSLSIWAILGSIGAAIVMILNAKRSGRMEANIEHSESLIKELNNGTDRDIEDAKVLQQGIKAKKDQARAIRKKSEAAAERIGEDKTMADVMHRFDNGRVRRRSTLTAEPKRSRKTRGKR